ncbi:MAG: hypothetical protein R3F17_04075 [Planctomycetota bacterium]
MAQWKISARQAACSVCEKPFADGERHHSMVHLTGDQLARKDACQGCWDAGRFGPGSEADGDGNRFWWTTRHQEHKHQAVAMDMEAIERLFIELTERQEVHLRELRYVLCLLLMRKKRVKLERILRDDSGESFIVRRPRSEERHTVEVFDFTPERMAEVRARLQAIFDGVDEDESLSAAAQGEGSEESEQESGEAGSAAEAEPVAEADLAEEDLAEAEQA